MYSSGHVVKSNLVLFEICQVNERLSLYYNKSIDLSFDESYLRSFKCMYFDAFLYLDILSEN